MMEEENVDEVAVEFVDYDNNRLRVRKSVHYRKYHIENVLMDLSGEFNVNYLLKLRIR